MLLRSTANEYVLGEAPAKTVYGFFSIFKRGFKGIYHYWGEQRPHRYLAEYDFRYNNRSSMASKTAAEPISLWLALKASASPYEGLAARKRTPTELAKAFVVWRL